MILWCFFQLIKTEKDIFLTNKKFELSKKTKKLQQISGNIQNSTLKLRHISKSTDDMLSKENKKRKRNFFVKNIEKFFTVNSLTHVSITID